MTVTDTGAPLRVYWQPGCSSCLKTKEFLLAKGIGFESINVLENDKGFRDLEALGLKIVPIVARGDAWAHGADFRKVAEVAGFEWHGHDMLPPSELVGRIDMILTAAHRYADQIPGDGLVIFTDRSAPGGDFFFTHSKAPFQPPGAMVTIWPRSLRISKALGRPSRDGAWQWIRKSATSATSPGTGSRSG